MNRTEGQQNLGRTENRTAIGYPPLDRREQLDNLLTTLIELGSNSTLTSIKDGPSLIRLATALSSLKMDAVVDVSTLLSQFSDNDTEEAQLMLERNDTITWQNPADATRRSVVFQSVIGLVYTTIFVVGLLGNLLVCYVVIKNKHMRTVTNFFITNLGLADIMLCTLAGPITATEYILGDWVFGRILCKLIPCTLGVSVYLSVLTLTSIAIDRYLVILYPFRPRMKESTCLMVIGCMWVSSVLLTLPYGIYMDMSPPGASDRTYCYEAWPPGGYRKFFTTSTCIAQFAIPFIITAFCYVRIWLRLRDRSKNKPGAKSAHRDDFDRIRKRRTNRMLVAMVIIFGLSWLPLNTHHLLADFNVEYANEPYVDTVFFITHMFAMGSACYNPLLYAWLNDNFRKEFRIVLPCFFSKTSSVQTSVRTTNGHHDLPEPTAPPLEIGSEPCCQKPLLPRPQCNDLIESKVNGNGTETSYFTGNLISCV